MTSTYKCLARSTSPARRAMRLRKRERFSTLLRSARDYSYEHPLCVSAARRDHHGGPCQCHSPCDGALAPALWPRPRSSRISRPGADRAPSWACSRCPANALRPARWRLYATAAALPAPSGQLNAPQPFQAILAAMNKYLARSNNSGGLAETTKGRPTK